MSEISPSFVDLWSSLWIRSLGNLQQIYVVKCRQSPYLHKRVSHTQRLHHISPRFGFPRLVSRGWFPAANSTATSPWPLNEIGTLEGIGTARLTLMTQLET